MKLFKARIILFIGICISIPNIINAQEVTIKLNPAKVYLIKSNHQQLLSSDFYFESTREDSLFLIRIEVKLLDKNNMLLMQKDISRNGVSPGILTIPDRMLRKEKILCVFNPFHTFDPDIPVTTFEFKFTFIDNDGKNSVDKIIKIAPSNILSKTEHNLPFQNELILIKDGNDYYSHHRRVDLASAEQFNVTRHGNRYAYDFCPVNDKGELFKNSEELLENWFGFGKDVYATADGTVVETYNETIDSKVGEIDFSYRDAASNHKLIYGNYIIIDHHNGEFSGYMHLKKGSVKYQTGDKVKQGEIIGQLGNSGDSFIPHLHYQLSNATTLLNSDGIPIYFSNYERVVGKNQIHVKKGYINTGEFIRAKNLKK